MRRSICLFTDSIEPSGLGEHMLTLAAELAPDWRVSLACPPSTLGRRVLDRARALGLETFDLDERGEYRASDSLEHWLGSAGVDLLHVHAGIGWEGLGAARSARRSGVSAAVRTEHLPYLLTDPAQRAAHRRELSELDRVICVSEGVAQSLIEGGIRPEVVRVVKNGVYGLAGERNGAGRLEPVVLAIGRLTEQKGHRYLVEAMAAVPHAHLLIVGEGPLERALVEQVERLGLRGRVELLPEQDDVVPLLAAAAVLALPSVFEGLPLVALEAMSLGVPVVGTSVCGLTEAVEDGVTGRLVPSRDPEALAIALRELLSTPELGVRLGEAGRERQRREFTAGRMARETAGVYEEVLRSASAPRRARAQSRALTRVGFVGAGVIASRHLANLLTFDDVSIAAVADVVPERAAELARRAGARAYGDHEELLGRERLDALYVCVPPFAHGPAELAAVELGLPFFVEKPLAADLETAETIAAGVKDRGLTTAVGYHWRYLDTYERARELLADNPARLALGHWLDGTPPPAWWVREELSGGQTVEQTTHVLDLARTLVGDVTTVYGAAARTDRHAFAHSDIADVSTATLQFESGAVGSVSSTCLLAWPHRIGLHIFCEGMALELSEFELMVDIGRGRPVTMAQGDPFLREDRDFLDAVQGGEDRIRVPYHEALRTHRVACAIARSAAEGRAVSLHDAVPA